MREWFEAHKHQICCILGMAMIWPSVHNQLLYPLTFSFHKEGQPVLYHFYFLYAAVLFIVTMALVLDRRKILSQLLQSQAAISFSGMLGSVGLLLLIACDFSNSFSFLMLGVGVVLSAHFVPIHFVFWSNQLVNVSVRRATFDFVLSYVVFCAITALRLGLKLHAWPFALVFPLVSALLAVYALTQKQKNHLLRRSPFSELPLNLIVPAVLLLYAGTVIISLTNPVDASFEYPPWHRVLIYISVMVLMLGLAALYRPKRKLRSNASVFAFAVIAAVLVGTLLVTGLEFVSLPVNDNFPTIAAKITLEMFIWLMVIEFVQAKHLGIINYAAGYLVGVVGLGNVVSILIMRGSDLFRLSSDELPLLAITIVLAFAATLIVNVTMAATLARRKPSPIENGPEDADDGAAATEAGSAPGNGGGGAGAGAAGDAATAEEGSIEEQLCEKMRRMLMLSPRETDTLRLVLQHKTAKAIAAELHVAESTVNTHMKSIYRKCDVHSRKELFALAATLRRDIEQ
ncbi:MAG: LuxR C-terminal-related transcriptional regulator [Coriobacteriales bacterium]